MYTSLRKNEISVLIYRLGEIETKKNEEINLFNTKELNKVLNGSDYQKKWYLINLSQWHASRKVQ